MVTTAVTGKRRLEPPSFEVKRQHLGRLEAESATRRRDGAKLAHLESPKSDPSSARALDAEATQREAASDALKHCRSGRLELQNQALVSEDPLAVLPNKKRGEPARASLDHPDNIATGAATVYPGQCTCTTDCETTCCP